MAGLTSAGFVPDLRAVPSEADQLAAAAAVHAPAPAAVEPPVLEAPFIHSTPISEFSGFKIAINAFPTLFPTGAADFNATRETKVTELEWAGHMLRYDGDRFAQHPTFRFYACNTHLRHQSRACSQYFVRTHRNDQRLSVSDVREMIQSGEGEALANRIARYGSRLPGTRPFWTQARSRLTAQIRDKTSGPPNIFFTLSAADVQWFDLHRLMPGQQPMDVDEHALYKWRLSNLNSNPALAADFFIQRFETFFDTVVKKILTITDHWYRFEWQHRGSSHIHGFLWVDGAPSLQTLNINDEASIQAFIDFWDPLVSTTNPHTPGTPDEIPPALVHPSSWDMTTLQYTQTELGQLLNRVQRHTKHAPGYCLRKKKAGGQEYCRFDFPKELQNETVVIEKAGPRDSKLLELLTQRNDPLLNAHCVPWVMSWLANMDFRPIASDEAPLAYASKYVSKAEPASSTYVQVLKSVMTHLGNDTNSAVAYQKLLSSVIAERDMPGMLVHSTSVPH
jgi:ATP-dependent DNA helicase PIF1